MEKDSSARDDASRTADEQGEAYVNALPKGARISEFEIVRVLGEGGFGVVYLTFDHSLHRSVAVKEYLPGAYAMRRGDHTITVRSPQFRETFDAGLRSFIQEARLLAQFEHPALVKVLRFWEANGTAYMAMPQYLGRTLRETLKADPRFASEAALRALVTPLLEAVELLHRQQCFHRDISPDNIIVQPSGAPVLLDFGAARRIIGDMTQALTVVLKPGYAPIEQYVEDGGLVQGAWTDVYGLAAVLYTVIAGKPPPAAVARGYKDSMVPLSNNPPAGYSPEFLRGIDAGLAVRPEDRPQSIAAFREALGLTGADVSPPPVFVPPPLVADGVADARTGGKVETGANFVWTGQPPIRPATAAPARGRRGLVVGAVAIGVAAILIVGWVARYGGGELLPFLASSDEPARVAIRGETPSGAPRLPTEAPSSPAAAGDVNKAAIPSEQAPAVSPSEPTVPSGAPSPSGMASVPGVAGGSPDSSAMPPSSIVPPTKTAAAPPAAKAPEPAAPPKKDMAKEAPPAATTPESAALAKKDKTKEAPPPAPRTDRQPAEKAGAAPGKSKAGTPPPEEKAVASVPPPDAARPTFRFETEKSPDSTEALKDFSEEGKRSRIEADRGDAAAQIALARMHANGQGAPRSDAEAARWYRRAADQGSAQAQSALGDMYRMGRGGLRGDAEAVQWYYKAAEQGNAQAQTNLGIMYATGRGVARNEAEAVVWYRKAAEQGNAQAQTNLGILYANGQGVAKDEAEAVKWYRKAADQGNGTAQNNLGAVYAAGRGVPKDEAEAVRWYRKAADQGNAVAQTNLGMIYASGQGVPKDEMEAAKWYRKAADQGYAAAAERLKALEASGRK